jgi:hypothetical protein
VKLTIRYTRISSRRWRVIEREEVGPALLMAS